MTPRRALVSVAMVVAGLFAAFAWAENEPAANAKADEPSRADVENVERKHEQVDVAIGIEASSAEFRLLHVRALPIAESLRTLYGESNAWIAAHVPMNTVFVRASNTDQLEEISQFIRLIDVEKLK